MLFWIIAITAGLIIGSFLNVVIYRGPALWGLTGHDEDPPRGNLAFPRSYCPDCRTQIKAPHLIPVLGYFLLKGKCANCTAPISPRYLLVELTGGAITGVAIAAFGFSFAAAFFAIFGWLLLALAIIDFDTTFLPDMLTLPLAAIGLTAAAAGIFIDFLPGVIGAAAGYGVFWAISAAYRRWRGVEALGLGDAKLLGALGAWTGWQALPAIILIGSLATLSVIAASALRGKKVSTQTALPFGPGLCLGGFIILLANSPMVNTLWPL